MTIGQVAEALKTRPDFIVVLLMQALTMWLIWQGIGLAAKQRQERELVLLERCIDRGEHAP